MSADTFVHLGIVFKVVCSQPKKEDLAVGQWVRVLRGDPFEPKEDVVGTVISHSTFWANTIDDGLRDDYRIVVATDGDGNVPYPLYLWEPFEIIEPQSPSLADKLLNERRRTSRPGPRAPMDIVVCFDGTWNQNETQSTNVHRILGLVDKTRSISNYYSGVGIGGRVISNLLDGLSGRGVFRIVRTAYTFVRANFIAGDRLFIFGFSRGAYAARHLAGMIARVGINHHMELGYDQYRLSLINTPIVHRQSGPGVHFLGMLDCVPGNQLYTFGRSSQIVNNPVLEPSILNFAHAVSRDERCWSFRPLIFKKTRQRRFNQVWLPGYHFDLGGDQNPPLNNFALTWMLAEACECGLTVSAIPDLPSDPTKRGRCSDWLTTKLGLACVRARLPDAALIADQPNASEPLMRLSSAMSA